VKDKYLPIGSIVDIHDTNKSVMIVGYYAIKYQNVVKMYDYMGVSYPEGTLLDGTFAFNHEDIIKVLFEGYRNASFDVLNKNMLNQNDQNTNEFNKNDNFVNVKYDDNGVVAYEEYCDSKSVAELVQLLKNRSVKNPFETADTIDVAPSAVPIIEQGTTKESSDSKAAIDKQNIEDNLNIALEKEEEQKDAAEEMETVKIEIPNYKFTEDGIIFND
jgi:hypothetical protein